MLPFGTSKADCQGKLAAPGTAVTYAENIEPLNKDGNFVLDATQGIAGLYPVAPAPELTSVLIPGDTTSVPTNILKLVSGADDVRNNLIDPAQLPVDPVSCNPVYPHQYLQVNTIFEVAHANGLRTAWTDKHPAYEILNGPSGYGIDDLFAPEINSVINLTDPSAPDWTKNNVNTQQYDTIKVLSVINEIKGFDHSGLNRHGTPAIFGMNFQAVSTAQKLNKSATPESPANANQVGGYTSSGTVPGSVLQSALHFVDESLKQMQAAIDKNASTKSNTVIILSAKHGQSPQDRSELTLINDGDMLAALEAAWSATNPSISPLVAHAMDDDGVLLWLNDRTATDFVKNFLMNYSGTGISSDAAGVKIPKPFTNAGLSQVLAGSEAANSLGLTLADQRAPDVIGYAKAGSVYGGGKLSKIAEHGGHAVADRAVPIVVSGANIGHHTVNTHVDTIQIAPTILHLLGLNPEELKAVKMEGTKVLPDLN